MSQKIFKAVVLFAVVLCGSISCNVPELPDIGTESGVDTGADAAADAESGRGTLILRLPGAKPDGKADVSRHVLSPTVYDRLKYRVILTGPGSVQTVDPVTDETSISLQAGIWTIRAEAYDPDAGNVMVGAGEAVVNIIAGQSASQKISIALDEDYGDALTEIYIRSEAELRKIGTDFAIDGSIDFYLEEDIDLTEPWTPIGRSGDPFIAGFDGQDHTITINGFTDAALSGTYIGLFGLTDGAKIRDLKIQYNLGTGDSPLVLTGSAYRYVGALAGLALHSEFDTITVSGSIGVSAPAFFACGGVVGYINQETTIRKSSFTGTIWGENQNTTVKVGGIVGDSGGAGLPCTIEDCYVSARVEAVGGTATTYVQAGGIAGGNTSGTIERCYAWADVSAYNAGGTNTVDAGGIVGRQEGTSPILQQCYARGTVIAGKVGSSSSCYSGGISGRDSGSLGSIMNCAALNTSIESVNSSNAHRILGDGESSTLNHNFADGEMTVTGDPPEELSPEEGPASKDGDGTYGAVGFLESPGTVYGSDYLDWAFDTGTDWKFIPSYEFPVLYWQNSPPAALQLPS